MEIKQISFNALARPKYFLQITDGDLSVYIRSWPHLLILRLWLAKLHLKSLKWKLAWFKDKN